MGGKLYEKAECGVWSLGLTKIPSGSHGRLVNEKVMKQFLGLDRTPIIRAAQQNILP